jgi:hypothetical protein
LPAIRAFQNRAGARTHSFFWFSGKIRTLPVCKKQLQTALIVSVTFIFYVNSVPDSLKLIKHKN